MKYKIKFTSRFKKDLKQAKRQGKDIEKLFDVVKKIAKDEMDEKSFNAIMAKGYDQVNQGDTYPIEDVFEELEKDL